MCWTDRVAIRNILQLKDEFNLRLFAETGCWEGLTLELYSYYFYQVIGCDVNPDAIAVAEQRLRHRANAVALLAASDKMIPNLPKVPTFFFLDAHFMRYGDGIPWAVQRELNAMGERKDVVLCIHDYKVNGLGYIEENRQPLDWSVVGDYITKVNPDFWYYANTKEMCDIVTPETFKELPITDSKSMPQLWSDIHASDFTRYRGILYAVPHKLDLIKYSMVKYEPGQD